MMRKETDLLLAAVLDDLEGVFFQIRDETVPLVAHGEIERNHVHVGPQAALLWGKAASLGNRTERNASNS